MSAAALTLALAAAVLHAFWNLILARARDVEAATAVAFALAIALYAPAAALSWDVEPEAWPYIAASAAFELLYIALLAAAYRRAQLSVVYPVARGTAPVLVLLLSLAILDANLGRSEIAGVLAVSIGVALVRGFRAAEARGLTFGLGIAACIACYTLIDSRGIEHASPVAYLEVVMVGPSLLYLAAVARLRGVRALRADLGVPIVLAALATFGAFALALAALQLAPAAAVAAVRETSVLIAVGLAALALREPVGATRAAGAALVVAGVALLSL